MTNLVSFQSELIHGFLENSAVRFPEKTAIIHDDVRVTYRVLNLRADNLSHYLVASGSGKGDRIALLLENGVDYITAYYAVLKSGAVAAPLSTGLKPDGLRELIDHLEPSVIITHCKFERLLKAAAIETPTLKRVIIRNPGQKWHGSPFIVSTLEEALTQRTPAPYLTQATPSSMASIIYTSGSTGRPRGVMLTHANIVSNTLAVCQYLKLTAQDIQMVVLPFFYVMGKSLLNTHVAVGGSVVINNRFMYPAEVVHQLIGEQVTGFSGVPSTYAYLLHRSPLAGCRDKLPHLRYCSQAGGHMAASIKKQLRRALPDHTEIFIMYGATEAGGRLTYLDPAKLEAKIDSIGKPIPGVNLRVLNAQGRAVPDGSEGELVAAGPGIMQGYWKDPRETEQVLDAQGYYTGDIGFRDTEGFFYVTRRKDSLLKVGGHRINPIEIEDFLLSTGLVIECAVIDRPDALLGRKLIALAVPRDAHCEPVGLMQRCSENLPGYKVPAEIKLVRQLPKSPNGKIDRASLIGLTD